MSEENFTWFAGVDWGSEKHQACIVDAQGNVAGEREFPHSGAGLAELGDWLLSIAGAVGTVAIGIEVPHGPVVDSLIDRGFVVHAINPKQLDPCATGSVSPVPRTIAETPMSWLTVYARTGVCFVGCMLLMHSWSNCERGRDLPRNCRRNGFG